jgi:hypothetical protein
LNQAIGALGQYSLVTLTEDSLTTHRLVQTVVRASLDAEHQQEWAGAAVRLVSAAFPSSADEVEHWATCAMLLPHALAVVDHTQALAVESKTTARLCIETGVYLWSRGQYRQTLPLYEQGLIIFRRVLGDDDPTTLVAMDTSPRFGGSSATSATPATCTSRPWPASGGCWATITATL